MSKYSGRLARLEKAARPKELPMLIFMQQLDNADIYTLDGQEYTHQEAEALAVGSMAIWVKYSNEWNKRPFEAARIGKQEKAAA